MARKPKRGDEVRVAYFDLVGDFSGNPEDAIIGKGTILGFYWGEREIDGLECLLVTITQWEDGDWQQGYHAVPTALVRRVEVISGTKRPTRAAT